MNLHHPALSHVEQRQQYYACVFFESIKTQTAQLCGSSLDFEFIRECMKINKIRPKFHFLTKVEIKMTYVVYVFCYLLSLRL